MVNVQQVGFVQIIDGEREGSQIIHFLDGYFYHKHHYDDPNHFIHLRCVKRNQRLINCRGCAVVSRDGLYYRLSQQHTNHGPDMFYVEELNLRSLILRRCAFADPTPFHQIVREEGQRGGFSVEARSRVTAARLRTAMRNVRVRNLPAIPRNLAVLGATLSDPRYAFLTATLDGQDNVFAGYCGRLCDGTVSVVFASKRMMALLQDFNKVFADGTFKKRPKKPSSAQLFNISCSWENRQTRVKHTIVAVRALMQRKTEDAYRLLFQFLKHLMPQWQPNMIICDHERAQVNAWISEFPNVRVVTCLWHYAVDVFGYAKMLHLHALMLTDPLVDCIVRCCCVIPMLPNYLMSYGVDVIEDFARQNDRLRHQGIRSLLSYLRREWMSNRIEYLSVCGSEDRTNNVSESVNAALGWEIKQDRPHVYEATRAFVRQEDQFSVDVHALRNGLNPGRAQKISSLVHDEHVANLTTALLQNQISVLHYLVAVAQQYQAPYQFVFYG